jgi:hypothetical protein
VLRSGARVVRGIYFDKHKEANWKVAWHQDLTIAVHERADIDGYGSWSMKAGIPHVQPPVFVLQSMLTLRLHMDHTDESNGALPQTWPLGRAGFGTDAVLAQSLRPLKYRTEER